MDINRIPNDKLNELDSRDRDNLRELSKRLQNSGLSAISVGSVLPEAIASEEKSQHRVSKSMVEITENAIGFSISRDPERLSTALFPIIGSAIKKAVNQMMSEMMASINASMENMFSIQRVRWKIESRKTGIPYTEIVLKNTMRYRVEHIFLIHRESSLLLHEISAEKAFPTDSDIVASMLGAVKDYMSNSLSLEKGDSIHTISAGEYSLLIEDGPLAILAVMVKGSTDTALQEKMLESLEGIHLKLSSELSSFSGDTRPFQEEEALLRPCLLIRELNENKKPVYAITFVTILFLILLAGGGALVYSEYRHRLFVSALDGEPGILVAAVGRDRGKRQVHLLRDKRAARVEEIALSSGIDSSKYEFISEEFLSPQLGDTSTAGVPGISKEILDLTRLLQDHILLFESDSGNLMSDTQAEIQPVSDLIRELLLLADKDEVPLRIDITGHSSGSVQDLSSISVSEERAEMIYRLLGDLEPVFLEKISTKGVGIGSPISADESNEEGRMMNRSVSFEVIFE